MKKNKKEKKQSRYKWILKITIASFIISIFFSFISEIAIPNVGIVFGVFLALLFISIGVIFDMVGVSVTASDEAIFHSMAAQKVKGAKLAVKFKKNADKVSSFCQDVIGDICGIVSGSTGAVISLKIMQELNSNNIFITLIIMGIISALTIGGKATFKSIAMKNANDILYRFAYIISFCIKGR